VTSVRIILDTSATLASATGSMNVGEVVAEVAEEGARFGVPLLCLVEAVRQVSSESLPSLYLLGSHEHGAILSDQADHWRVLAGVARALGRADLACLYPACRSTSRCLLGSRTPTVTPVASSSVSECPDREADVVGGDSFLRAVPAASGCDLECGP